MARFFENMLGIEPPGPGQDTSWSLGLPRVWSSWVLLVFLIAAAAWFIALYRREGTLASRRYKLGLATLRWLLVVILVLMVAELDLRIDRRGLPYLALIVDDSESMSVADRYGDAKTEAAARALAQSVGLDSTRRIDLAKAVLAGSANPLLARLAAEHRLRLYAASSAMRSLGEFSSARDAEPAQQAILGLSADGADSRLGAGLRDVLNDLSGVPPAAIIYLTDGVTTDGESLPDAANYAFRKGVPVYAIGLGDPSPLRDLELRDLMVDDVVFVGDVVNFEAKLSAHGVEGGTATIRLHEKGSATPLATEQIDLPPGGQPTTVRLQHRPDQVGDITYVMEVEPLEREFQTKNNAIERAVSVREEKLRVLMVESYPRFEYRFLKHLLERDPSIDLSVLLLESDAEYAEEDRVAISHFPTSKEELRSYDVILFGDVNPIYLNENQLRNLNDFVLDKGGGLALLAGRRFLPAAYRDTPLETVIPIELSSAQPSGERRDGFRPVLTLEGKSNPMFRLGQDDAESQQIWQNLPPLYWLLEAPQRKPAALPLAVHPTLSGDQGPLPVILLQQAGAGKSLLVLSDETWRWRDRVGDLYFARFWVQAIRYLSRSRLVGQTRQAEVRTDRHEYQRGQAVEVRVRLFDEALGADSDGVTVVLERDGVEEGRLPLGRSAGGSGLYEAVFNGAKEGSYRAWMVNPPVKGTPPASTFEVRAPPGEFRKIEMDQASLNQVADRTGGHFYTFRNADELVRQIPAGRKIPLDTDPPIPLWNSWPFLALFMAVLVTEWLLRKRKRML